MSCIGHVRVTWFIHLTKFFDFRKVELLGCCEDMTYYCDPAFSLFLIEVWLVNLWWTERQSCSIHTHTHPFNGPLSGTTRLGRYQKGKTNLDFTEARDSEWQWHQLGHMQVCTSLQADNHASTPLLSFLQAGCPSCCPANSVKALKVSCSIYCAIIPLHTKNMCDLAWLGLLSICAVLLIDRAHTLWLVMPLMQ